MGGDRIDVGSQIELMPDAGDNGLQRANRGKHDCGQEAGSVGSVLDGDAACKPFLADAAAIHTLIDNLQAVDGAGFGQGFWKRPLRRWIRRPLI